MGYYFYIYFITLYDSNICYLCDVLLKTVSVYLKVLISLNKRSHTLYFHTIPHASSRAALKAPPTAPTATNAATNRAPTSRRLDNGEPTSFMHIIKTLFYKIRIFM